MKKTIIIGGAAGILVSASIATNVIMFKQLTKVEETVDNFEAHKISIPDHISKEMVEDISSKNRDVFEVLIKDVDTLKNEKNRKAEMYLSAARSSVSTPEIAQILYVAALNYSDNKAEILSEFIVWQTELIEKELRKGDSESATERLVAVATICDANIAMGSVNDMKAIPVLKSKLAAAEKLITDHKNKLIATQEKELEKLAQRADRLSSYSAADDLLKDLAVLTVDPSLSNKKEEITAKIILKQSYLTAPTDQLIIPPINNATPWNAWLKNFIVRLKSNLPVMKKLEDIGRAAEFLQVAKESDAEGVQDLIVEIEKESRNIYLDYWRERVEKTTASAEANLNDISTLISESNAFNPEEQKKYEAQIIKLHKYITKTTLAEFKEGVKHLKALEKSFTDETYMQMVGSMQAQYIQLLLRLKALDAKFANQFYSEVSEATQQVKYFSILIDSYKKKLTANELEKVQIQRNSFIAWARETINNARVFDNRGEEIANKTFATRKSPEAVDQYASGWLLLMSIHPNDLQAVDPALFQIYSTLKSQIESHWTPSDYHRGRVEYKRISDF